MKGSWIKINNLQKIAVTGRLKTEDFGLWFEKIHGITRIKHGKLCTDFKFQTEGTPETVFDIRSMKGEMKSSLDNMTIMQKDKKARNNFFEGILNLISLDSLSAFLTLDFSMLKKEARSGFKVFSLKGTLKLDNGYLKTKKVEMHTAVAKIDFSGKINLINNQNNLTMVIYPNIIPSQPLGKCPILFILRLPLWIWNKLADLFLDPFFNLKYHITGTLDNPIVKKK